MVLILKMLTITMWNSRVANAQPCFYKKTAADIHGAYWEHGWQYVMRLSLKFKASSQFCCEFPQGQVITYSLFTNGPGHCCIDFQCNIMFSTSSLSSTSSHCPQLARGHWMQWCDSSTLKKNHTKPHNVFPKRVGRSCTLSVLSKRNAYCDKWNVLRKLSWEHFKTL